MRTKAIIASVLALVISASAFGQSKVPADFTRDGFITAGVGGALCLEGLLGGFEGGVAPVVDITLGKWIIPSLGFRVGYQGFESRCAKQWVDNSTVHVDLLWNVINTFKGYDSSRMYSLVPYAQAGFMSSSKTTTSFEGGAGLLNIFKVSERLGVVLDARMNFVRGEQFAGAGKCGMGSVCVGVMVNLPAAK